VIVDDSIGMWVLRRITGRRLWERPWDDELTDDPPLDPSSPDSTRVALGAIAAANAADPSLARRPAAPTRYVASRHRKREIVASQTPVMDLRRRQQAQRQRTGPASRRRRLASLGLVAAVLVLVAVALGMRPLPPGPGGQVLASTGRPGSSGFAGGAPGTSGGSASPGEPDITPPLAAMGAPRTAAIPGHTLLSVSVRWGITDAGSGVEGQVFQWRTDRDRWVTVRLPSTTTRTVTLRLPPGHLYTFRVRGVDRAGNVGLFAVKSLRI